MYAQVLKLKQLFKVVLELKDNKKYSKKNNKKTGSWEYIEGLVIKASLEGNRS